MTAALSGLVLAMGLLQLLPRHPGSLAILCGAQALAAAAALAGQGNDPAWLAAAGIAVVLDAMLLPFLTWRLAEGRALLPRPRWAWAVLAMLALGVTVPTGPAGPALGVVLAGLLLVAARPDPVGGIAGLAGMQAGAMLLVAALPAPPLAGVLAAVIPLPAGLLLARQWANRWRWAA